MILKVKLQRRKMTKKSNSDDDFETRLKVIAIKQDAFLEGTYDWTTEDSNEYDLLTDRIRQSR